MPIELCFATLLALSAVFIALNENVFTRPEMRQSIAAAFGPALRGDISGNSLIWCLLLLAFAYPWFALRRSVASERPAIGSRRSAINAPLTAPLKDTERISALL